MDHHAAGAIVRRGSAAYPVTPSMIPPKSLAAKFRILRNACHNSQIPNFVILFTRKFEQSTKCKRDFFDLGGILAPLHRTPPPSPHEISLTPKLTSERGGLFQSPLVLKGWQGSLNSPAPLKTNPIHSTTHLLHLHVGTVDHRPCQPQQLGSLGIGQTRPQRYQLQRQFIATGPALDPSPTRIIVFRGDFGGSSGPISPTTKTPRITLFSLGFFRFLG